MPSFPSQTNKKERANQNKKQEKKKKKVTMAYVASS